MPLYDFECQECGERFESQVAEADRPGCPSCGAPESRRLLSPFAGPFTVGLRGVAARRSNAARQSREEQRRERSALRAAKRDKA